MALSNKPTDKRVIEIADFLYSNIDAKRGDVIKKFGKLWGRSDNTIDRLLSTAREYNKERLEKAQKARDEVLVQKEVQSLKEAIIERDEAIQILANIARGIPDEVIVGRDDNGEAIYKTIPVTPIDKTRAISELKTLMTGWAVPTKSEIKNVDEFSDWTEEELDIYAKTGKPPSR